MHKHDTGGNAAVFNWLLSLPFYQAFQIGGLGRREVKCQAGLIDKFVDGRIGPLIALSADPFNRIAQIFTLGLNAHHALSLALIEFQKDYNTGRFVCRSVVCSKAWAAASSRSS